MKIDSTQFSNAEQPYITVLVNQPNDYLILHKLIKVGDYIEAKIRRKEKSIKTKIFYPIAKMIVRDIEYTTDPEDTLKLSCQIISCDNENVKEGSFQNLWITDGMDFKLFKENWTDQDQQLIHQALHPEEAVEQKKNIISERGLQQKCFERLHKVMATNPSRLLFGQKDILNSTNNGLVDVLFLTEDFLDRQNDEWKKNLTSADQSYHGARLVIYDKGTQNYDELTNFGGAVAYLKKFASR